MSITSEQESPLQACLQSGRVANTSEVVRAALRLLDRDETGFDRAAPAIRLTKRGQDRA